MITGRNASTGPARPSPSRSDPQPNSKKAMRRQTGRGREKIHKSGGSGDHQATEGDEQKEETERDDNTDEERQFGGDGGGEPERSPGFD